MATAKINVYMDGSEWFGARWIDGEYDGCDELDVPLMASPAVAIAAAAAMELPGVTSVEVKLVDGPDREPLKDITGCDC